MDGSGITIGVISDSFNTSLTATTTYAQDIASGDLPDDVIVLSDGLGQFGIGDIDEGRAMMQLIHDIAPGADLMFHTVGAGKASFATAIDALVAAGADIIVDDIIVFSEARYQDDVVAQAAKDAVAAGVPFFSAIGNQGIANYTAAVDPVTVDDLQLHDWDPGPEVAPSLDIVIPGDTTFTLVLHWTDPYLTSSQGQSPGAATDLDMFALTEGEDGDLAVIAFSTDANIGVDPVEFMSVTNASDEDMNASIVVELFDGPVPAEMSITGFDIPGTNFVTGLQPSVTDGFGGVSTYGHSTAQGVIGVGAARFDATPAFGISGNQAFPERFTSLGGVTKLYDDLGTRLPAPVIDEDVDIIASQGGNNTFFGDDYVPFFTYPGGDPDPDTFPNFFGTSAAAPNAAAVAALMMELQPTLTPAMVESVLETTATDVDLPFVIAPPNGPLPQDYLDHVSVGLGPGYDNRTGHGFINAQAALAALSAPADVVSLYEDDTFAVLLGTFPDLAQALAASGAGAAIRVDAPTALGDQGIVTIATEDLTIDSDLPFRADITLDPGISDFTVLGTTDTDVTGNALGNVLTGSSGPNHVAGGGGGDMIILRNGDDTAMGQSGNDTIEGGYGNDSISGGFGSDAISGNGDNDTISGDAGGDILEGGMGDDSLLGGNGADTILGGLGADEIYGQGFTDDLRGGEDSDSLFGGGSSDTLDGEAGDDVLFGQSAADTLLGGTGRDYLNGGVGNDELRGGAQGDTLLGSTGDDELYGGAGADIFQFRAGHGAFDRIFDFQIGLDRIEFNIGPIKDIGDLVISDAFNGANVDYGSGMVRLLGLTANELSASDFAFV